MLRDDLLITGEYLTDTAVHKWRLKEHIHCEVINYLEQVAYMWVANANKMESDSFDENDYAYEITKWWRLSRASQTSPGVL